MILWCSWACRKSKVHRSQNERSGELVIDTCSIWTVGIFQEMIDQVIHTISMQTSERISSGTICSQHQNSVQIHSSPEKRKSKKVLWVIEKVAKCFMVRFVVIFMNHLKCIADGIYRNGQTNNLLVIYKVYCTWLCCLPSTPSGTGRFTWT